ncbi:hypothetical protein FRB95_007158 [Tulasnella sp. JGI-2019a]|nr:hypothetical protein FRB95_007158 [Tulasnella sp. JGI-2019a]
MPGSTGSDSGHTVPLEHITFDGQGSEDVTVFLQSVKRVALVQGRQRDDDWMVDYAEASLTGDALRWFSDLDEGTLRSWRTVRNAFLKRFTTPVARSARMSASTAPAPAASAAAPAAAPRMAVPQFSKLPKPNEVLGSILKGGNVYKALLVGKSGWLGYGWNNQSSPTEGVTYQMLLYSYSGVPWETHMWDSSGTMHCKTLASQYAATLDRVWIVYDVTDQSSFDIHGTQAFVLGIGAFAEPLEPSKTWSP